MLKRHRKKYDQHFLGGILLGFSFLGIAAFLSGGVLNFFSISAFFVVIGGTLAAAIVQYPAVVFESAGKEIKSMLYAKSEHSLEERYGYLQKLSRLVKEKGLVVLDRESQRCSDSFLRLALELSSDRTSPKQIQRIMSHEIASSYQRGMQVVSLLETMASIAPAMGLIGTVIGLINMFQTITDISSVSTGLSVALLTTLYGAVVANLIFAPLAGKLSEKEEERARIKRITLEGILSLSQEESPILFEQRLRSFRMTELTGTTN
ncbi:hypothetical protein EBR25_01245 [bacterium]|nr:hypothetical protein [bacterium]